MVFSSFQDTKFVLNEEQDSAVFCQLALSETDLDPEHSCSDWKTQVLPPGRGDSCFLRAWAA